MRLLGSSVIVTRNMADVDVSTWPRHHAFRAISLSLSDDDVMPNLNATDESSITGCKVEAHSAEAVGPLKPHRIVANLPRGRNLVTPVMKDLRLELVA